MVWTRTSTAARSSRPALDRDRIVRAAVDLLDEQGLDGLTMRRLGAKLDSGATTIYWHVPNREAVLDLAVDHILGEVEPAKVVVEGSGRDWLAELRRVHVDMFAMVWRHRWFATLIGTRPEIGPNGTRLNAGTIDVLSRAGFAGADLDGALWGLGNYVTGAASFLISWDDWLHGDPADLEATRAYAQEAIAPFPAYAAHVENYLKVGDPDEMREVRFSVGLDCLLDGLAARLERH